MADHFLLTRRRVINLGLGTMLGVAGAMQRAGQFHSLASEPEQLQQDFAMPGQDSLKQRAAAKGLIFGAASRYQDLRSNPKLAAAFVRDCGLLVPEWELKWSAGSSLLRPAPDEFDFSQADWMADFAQTHHLLFQGHTLVWHLSLPHWFAKTVHSQNAEQVLSQHIQRVVQHYRGRIHSWCVVNEAIAYDPRQGRSDGLQESPWLAFLGPEYIDLSFRLAAQADPEALLFYNDYGLDYDNPLDEAKRTAVLKLLERLKSSGTPIHALGMQAHLRGEAMDFNPQKLRRFLKDVASLGLKIMITELDVNDQRLPGSERERDASVAGVYENYLTTVLDEPAVSAVITWGLSDRYTYLSEARSRMQGRAVRPLPLDQNLQIKPAWKAIARALDQAPRR
jgi:endo-1,4-beta-xylanase